MGTNRLQRLLNAPHYLSVEEAVAEGGKLKRRDLATDLLLVAPVLGQ